MKNKYTLQEFCEAVSRKNMLHAKFLDNALSDITLEESDGFEKLLGFYIHREESSLEKIVDRYLNMILMMIEEQKYFIESGKYRFSTFSEVENCYKDPNYMKDYTVGLGLSVFLWRFHRRYRELFDKALLLSNNMGAYLEIGPGHGEYFVTAMRKTSFKKYTAIDISKTSVDLTQDYIRHSIPDTNKKYEVINEDVFNYCNPEPFDMVVMGEVLEHVETPNVFLRRIHKLASDNAIIFITTAINAPQIDHIYQFNNLKEVTDLIQGERFVVLDSVVANINNLPLEKAEKRKVAINVGFIIKKC